jgi:hypothetical protein
MMLDVLSGHNPEYTTFILQLVPIKPMRVCCVCFWQIRLSKTFIGHFSELPAIAQYQVVRDCGL